MNPAVKKLVDHFQMEELPVEGTHYKRTYLSKYSYGAGPLSTAIIGLYSKEPISHSRFHRLQADEIWHFYKGDPFALYLLYPDGSSRKVIMGKEILKGHKVQYVVPANVWQAGELLPGGTYALFGCTMTPGFTPDGFEGGQTQKLLKDFPGSSEVIKRLGVSGTHTRLPDKFEG